MIRSAMAIIYEYLETDATIAEHLNFASETTLGGRTMAGLLESALSAGNEVRIWYVGLRGP